MRRLSEASKGEERGRRSASARMCVCVVEGRRMAKVDGAAGVALS